MGNKRFSLTTYALVGISLVALYFVGKSVNPPPAAPPQVVTHPTAPVKPPPASPVESASAVQAAAYRKKEAERQQALAMRQAANHAKGPNPAEQGEHFNPNTIQTGADYWHQNQMGKKGEVQMKAKVEDALKKQAPRPGAPSPTPAPAPAAKAPSGSTP